MAEAGELWGRGGWTWRRTGIYPFWNTCHPSPPSPVAKHFHNLCQAPLKREALAELSNQAASLLGFPTILGSGSSQQLSISLAQPDPDVGPGASGPCPSACTLLLPTCLLPTSLPHLWRAELVCKAPVQTSCPARCPQETPLRLSQLLALHSGPRHQPRTFSAFENQGP